MRSVMMDRWGIDSAFQYLGGDLRKRESYDYELYPFPYKKAFSDRCADLCWENFLTAIVLWDEIWSFTPYDWEQIFRAKSSVVQDSLKRIMHQVNSSMINRNLLTDYYLLTKQNSHIHGRWRYDFYTYAPYEAMDYLDMIYSPSLHDRTCSYQAISQCLGVPYLAHPFRENRIIDDDSQQNFNRRDVLARVDKELERYYHFINDELGRNLYQFRYPVLVDLIKQGASTPEEELLSALELREEPDVYDFRDAMNDIEQAVQSGNTQELLSELDFISHIAENITMKYKNRGATLGEFSVSIPFSVSLTWPTPQRHRPERRYKPQATFIRRLINYGVNERPLDR